MRIGQAPELSLTYYPVFLFFRKERVYCSWPICITGHSFVFASFRIYSFSRLSHKIGTDVMPVPHIITLGFSTIMPVF